MELSCENCVNEKVIHKGKYDIFLECQDCLKGCVKVLDTCCIKPDLISVNMPRKDNAPTKRNYCKNCHDVSGLVKMINPNEWKTLPLLTRSKADDLQRERHQRVTKFYQYLTDKRQQHFQARKKEHTERYHAYLDSPEWKDKRLRVLNRDKYICQGCLINKATQVHHLTYDRIFKEPLFDLTSVCNDCHHNIHEIDVKLFAGSSEEEIRNLESNKLMKIFGL